MKLEINWTKELPKEPGFYLSAVRNLSKIEIYPIKIFRDKHGRLLAHCWDGPRTEESGVSPDEFAPGLWSQPVKWKPEASMTRQEFRQLLKNS